MADTKDIDFSSFIFRKNDVFIEEEENPSWKVVKIEDELDGIDIEAVTCRRTIRRVFWKILQNVQSLP